MAVRYETKQPFFDQVNTGIVNLIVRFSEANIDAVETASLFGIDEDRAVNYLVPIDRKQNYVLIIYFVVE